MRWAAAAAALEALRDGRVVAPALARRLHRPTPRLREGHAAAAGGATAMIDISDGLAMDLGHVCDASRVGARVQETAVPLAPGATFPHTLDGDDYELCFTAPDPETVARHFARSGCTPPSWIGVITRGQRLLVRADGTETPLLATGWDHVVP